jgi:hypothetical protein
MQSVMLRRMRVIMTLAKVIMTLITVVSVVITFVRVKITLCVWKLHSACKNHTLRLEITLCL